ncbi:MAG: 3'(2'),5'-bisphosphate nucleotidase CysQ [Acidobacteriota bacterium]
MFNLDRELELALALSRIAGDEVLRIYAGDFDVEHKQGEGPVTIADRRADQIIRDGIHATFPQDAVLSEETPDDTARLSQRRLWLVDPLDGTRQFVARLPEFAVMIGLAVEGVPRLGVVHMPVESLTCYGVVGSGAWQLTADGSRRELSLLGPRSSELPLQAAVSRLNAESRTHRVIERLGAHPVRSGSVGRKAALVATGEADFYLTLGGQSQHWDACAPDALLRAAGGFFGTASGEVIAYNTPLIRNTDGLIACRPELLSRLVPEIARVRAEASPR